MFFFTYFKQTIVWLYYKIYTKEKYELFQKVQRAGGITSNKITN